MDKLATELFESQQAWESWLDRHYEDEGVWLKIAKKNTGAVSVSYYEALESALCFGWIDGLVRSYDDKYYIQRFTPRRSKSVWSKVNVEKVESLFTAGKMKPSGIAAVEAAKQDGRWDRAYDSQSKMTVSEDFQTALDEHPLAKAFYTTLDKANVYAILWRIQTARNSEARQAKIAKLILMLEKGEKIHK